MIAPFPYFGGKSKVAHVVWQAFGDTPNYVEPFAGSLAVLLARLHDYRQRIETVNDAEGMIANYWRATQQDPDAVARWADWPINEADLHARHLWLVSERRGMTERLMGNPDYCDAKIAGWWLWGICQWIGGSWCSGKGPWVSVDGVFTKRPPARDVDRDAPGVSRERPALGSGVGIYRRLPQLDSGRGIHRRLRNGAPGGLAQAWSEHIRAMMRELADRLRCVRVCCGDWSRVCTTVPTTDRGVTGVFLDPPYSKAAGRDANLYATDSMSVAVPVREWAIEHGDDPKLRIALCGYEGEHTMPASWRAWRWKAHGGMANVGHGPGKANRERETIWFSPHCLLDGLPDCARNRAGA